MDSSVHSWVVYCVLMAIVTLAALLDYKNHSIPNWLSFSGWYLGPVLCLSIAGTPALNSSLIALVLVLVLTFPLFVIGWMGAGDVKLMTSVAALAGTDHVILFISSILIAGFVVAVMQMLVHGVFVSFVRRYWLMLGLSIASSRPVYVNPSDSQRRIVLPYAIPIAIGTMVSLCLL